MKKNIKAGATDQTLDIFVQDSSLTTGAGLTGLVFNTASLVCYYRKGATGTPTALTLATQTVGGAHSDGGFVAVDGANMPGVYRLDLSDTIVATAGSVSIMLRGAANMAPVTIELQVVAYNPEDSVRLGLTALPNAAAEAAGGLYTRGTGAGQINQNANGQVDANATHAAGTAWGSGAITAGSIASDAITAAKIAAGAIDAATFAADTGLILRANTCQAGSTGTTIVLDAGASATNSTYVGCNVAITGGTGVGQVRTITAYTGATVTATVPTWQTTPDGTSTFAILPGYAVIAVLGSVTGNVAGSVGSVTGAVGSVTGAVGSVTGAVGSVTGNVGGNVTGSVGSVAANGITTSSIATDAINANSVKADAVTKIQAGLATPTNITAGTITTVTNLTNAPTSGDLTATMKASVNTEADTAITDAALATASALAAVQADLPNRPTKNTALAGFPFKMVDATDGFTAETGIAVTATRSLDGAAFGACANSASEVANGWYKIDLAAGDLNGNTVVLRLTGTGCRTTEYVIVTQTT